MVRPAPQTASQCAKMDVFGEDNHLKKGAERTMNKHSKAEESIKVVGIDLLPKPWYENRESIGSLCRIVRQVKPRMLQ